MDAPFHFKNQHLSLLPEKALLWHEPEMLVIADLHLGKASHFRKAGIAVPNDVNRKNLRILSSLLFRTQPKRVLFLGDLFHSDINQEWERFGQTIRQFPGISFELVMGNHDIMAEQEYAKWDIKCYDETYADGPYLFTHEPLETVPSSHYPIAGHIHPGVKMRGRAHQSIKLPCFWFGKEQALMPAFGAFTGLAMVKLKKGDQVFVIAGKTVKAINR